MVVALPVVQNDFGATRGTASLAFTMVMLGFGSGGVLTGKITDRYGIVTAIGLVLAVPITTAIAAATVAPARTRAGETPSKPSHRAEKVG